MSPLADTMCLIDHHSGQAAAAVQVVQRGLQLAGGLQLLGRDE
jgi:hypothetical protein